MSQLTFRNATPADARQVATLLTASFANYPMYRTILNRFFKTNEAYYNYLNKLHYVQAMTNIRKGHCLVAEINGTIIATAVMQELGKTHFTLTDYLRSGALPILQYLRPTLHFLPFLEKSSLQAKTNAPAHSWYLESYVVHPQWQGQQIGSRFFHESIFPYITQKGAQSLALVTNTYDNCRFYTRHGFTQTHYHQIQNVDVWTFIAKFQQPPSRTNE
nr:GNAT family N-acetyltransferase [uncultured Capnocytophaga sp.]